MTAEQLNIYYETATDKEKEELDRLPPEERIETLKIRARRNQILFFSSIIGIMLSLASIAMSSMVLMK